MQHDRSASDNMIDTNLMGGDTPTESDEGSVLMFTDVQGKTLGKLDLGDTDPSEELIPLPNGNLALIIEDEVAY